MANLRLRNPSDRGSSVFSSQSTAADAQALLPVKQTSRVPIGMGGGGTGSWYRLGTALHAIPEVRFGLKEVELEEPVGGDLKNLELVVAEDDRENRTFGLGDCHVVLELRHVALKDLIGFRECAGVLCFPHRASVFDQAIESAPTPILDRAGDRCRV